MLLPILALAVLVPDCVQAAVSSSGGCPSVQGISYFDRSRYLGVWYEYANVFEIFQIGATCVRATYTDEGDRIGVFEEGVNTITGRYQNVKGSARPAIPNSDRAELIVGNFFGNDDGGTEANYKVVDTDYSNYAVVYDCSPFPGSKNESLWLLTRQQKPETKLVISAYRQMEALGLPVNSLHKTDHTDCSKLPPEDIAEPADPIEYLGILGHGANCYEGGLSYSDGETWQCSDGCNTCSCNSGEVSSTLMLCPSLNCYEGGLSYSDGETWQCSDGCNTCSCNSGEVSSTLMLCPSSNCYEGGLSYSDGETWQCSDGCNTCSCNSGKVSSTRMLCPSPNCPSETPGFNTACRTAEEGLSCEYGSQTCCGETLPAVVMECSQNTWVGYYVDTVCMLGGSCPTDESCTTLDDCYTDGKMCDGIMDAGCLCKNGQCKISSGCGTHGAFFFTPCSSCNEDDCEDEEACQWMNGECMPGVNFITENNCPLSLCKIL